LSVYKDRDTIILYTDIGYRFDFVVKKNGISNKVIDQNVVKIIT